MPQNPLAGTGYNMLELPTMGGDQRQIYDLLKSQFMQGAPELYSQLRGQAAGRPEAFAGFEGPLRQQFQEQILPQIGQQFGLTGTQKSSGFQNTLARAGQQFGSDLASQRSQMQQSAMQQLLGLGNTLLGTPTSMFGATKDAPGADIMKLLEGGGGALGGILKELLPSGMNKDTDKQEGFNWGNLGSLAMKLLPLLGLL